MTTITKTVEINPTQLNFIDGTIFYGVNGRAIATVNTWGEFSSDLQLNQFVHSRGISGYQPTNRVASPGKFTFLLNNTSLNEGGVAGYYSPEHASAKGGFGTAAEVRIKYTSTGDSGYKWRGKIHRIMPDPGPFKYTKVVAYDWMKIAQDQKFKAITTTTDKRVDEAMTTVLASMATSSQPASTSFATGKSTLPYVFDSERTEKTSIMAVFQKLALTEMGHVFVDSGDGDGERLVFTNRHNATEETTVQHDFDDNVVSVNVLYPIDAVRTRVISIVFPRETDDANLILAQSLEPFNIAVDDPRTIELLFRDLTTADRISAASTVTPIVSGTDFVANTQSDGGGANVTGNTTVTVAEESGNSIKLLCEYSGAGTAWLTTLQIRGKGIYTYDPVTYTAEDSDAEDQYGDRVLRYTMPYEDDFNVGVSFGDYLLSVWKDPVLQLRDLTYYPEENDTLAQAFFDIDIGKRITVNITQLGIDADYFVRKETVRLDKGKLKVSYGLEPAGSSVWMKLNDAVYGKLNADECKAAF
jgi:hypothetical protein